MELRVIVLVGLVLVYMLQLFATWGPPSQHYEELAAGPRGDLSLGNGTFILLHFITFFRTFWWVIGIEFAAVAIGVWAGWMDRFAWTMAIGLLVLCGLDLFLALAIDSALAKAVWL